ncbi:hypothetical protein [Chryseobacterium tongliaoense]|uniref:hypothetical protein n=1 Tax=Chryseobacterium tongliaoense TaxID=3240933 RepID=UPI0035116731
MKQLSHTILGVFLLCMFNISCKKNTSVTASAATASQEMKKTDDTLITQPGIYLISPGEKEIDSLKKTMGEDQFYTAADDSNFYISKISSGLKSKLITIKHKNIDFKNDNYSFSKKDSKKNWAIIEYKEGNKPQIYSLVDFYNKIGNESAKTEAVASIVNIDTYLNNKDFLTTTIDINGDGKDDKIFSNKPNRGDSLLVYFYENNGYILKLKSTNLSQDGGNQVSAIKKNGQGFSIETDFPQGTDKYTYFVNYTNNNFTINKVIHEISSWQDDPNKLQVCVFLPQIALQKPTSEIFSKLIESEKKAKCSTRKRP